HNAVGNSTNQRTKVLVDPAKINPMSHPSAMSQNERKIAEQERKGRERAKKEKEAREREEKKRDMRETWAKQEEKGRELQRELMMLQEVKAKKTADALEMTKAADPREQEASTAVTSLSYSMYANVVEKEE
ncbi:unnamed protein product, partial [Sphacelaria rigidula]